MDVPSRNHAVIELADASELLAEAARKEPTYLDFIDSLLRTELDAKPKSRVTMAIEIAPPRREDARGARARVPAIR